MDEVLAILGEVEASAVCAPWGVERIEAALSALAAGAARIEAARLRLVAGLSAIASVDRSVDAHGVVVRACRTSSFDASRVRRRARTVSEFPELGEALAAGAVSAAHVDAVAAAVRHLDPDVREALADDGAQLAADSAHLSPEDLGKVVKDRAARMTSGEAEAEQAARQVRAQYARVSIDPATGMYRLTALLAPAAGAMLRTRLRDLVDDLLRVGVPDSCPDDDRRYGHLWALALVEAVRRKGTDTPAGPIRADLLLISDVETFVSGRHPGTRLEVGSGGSLPIDTVRRLACMADLSIITMRNGRVLDLARTTRVASANQRRALRAMYATCGIPGCQVAFDDCRIHHVQWWRFFGPTDLANLFPICSKHHHLVHEGGWELTLTPDRTLTVTQPDGNVSVTGPPYASTG